MYVPAISVQLYSVRDAIAADLPGTLDQLARLRFQNVERYGFVEHADQYASALAASDLMAPSAHAPVHQYEEPGTACEAAASLGVRTLIDPHYARAFWQTESDVLRPEDRMNGVGARAAEIGLSFGYYSHAFELESRIGDVSALEFLAAHLSPDVMLEVDTFWVEVGGDSAPDLLLRLGARVRLIHVKDGPLVNAPETELPAGQGAMAVRVLEFDDYLGDTIDGLAESLSYVTEHSR